MAKRMANGEPVSSDQEALLSAIIEYPDENTPRLAYADLLDEIGGESNHARAKLIRLQIDVNGMHFFQERKIAKDEINRILDRYGAAWQAEVGLIDRYTSYTSPIFRRGFVMCAHLTANQFLRAGEGLVARTPLRDIGLRRLGELVPKLAAFPALDRIRGLWINNQLIGASAAQTLTHSLHLRLLERLDLAVNGIGASGARAILEGTAESALKDVNFRSNHLGSTGATLVAECPAMAKHVALRLGDNDIQLTGARAIANSPYLGQVTVLDLDNNGLGLHSALAFVGSASLRPRHVSLVGNSLADRGIAALVAGSFVETVESLDLEANRIGELGAMAMARSPHLRCLRDLDLANNPVTDRAALALRAGLPTLKRLGLKGTLVSERIRKQLFGKETTSGILVDRVGKE